MFTSDLSVSEYVLLGEAGFEPLGFVVGSSIFHVGIQIGRWSQNAELQVLTQAMYSARELAMTRMRAEADHLGADGIVGVRCGCRCTPGARTCWSSWPRAPRSGRWAARGRTGPPTAARSPRTCPRRTSSGCWPRGAVPVAFVLGTCVYHIAHQSAMQALRQTGRNQEMLQFTQGVYEARELALVRMQAEATVARASGIVGVNVAVSNHVWGEHATEFLATGTAIRRLGEEHRLPATTPEAHVHAGSGFLSLDASAHIGLRLLRL